MLFGLVACFCPNFWLAVAAFWVRSPGSGQASAVNVRLETAEKTQFWFTVVGSLKCFLVHIE